MNQSYTHRPKILIVDDSMMNRSILIDILGDEYEFLEAENGAQGIKMIQEYGMDLSLVLLDIVMPEIDGFGVLQMMNEQGLIETLPVIMISAETRSVDIEKAYEMGVTDYINRPFDAMVVHRRVINTIMLYTKQKKLVDMVVEQIYAKEHQSNLMVDILSHIVEFRNGESRRHVRNVNTLTGFLLNRLAAKSDRYPLSSEEISRICMASALHDVGKISIDEKILNKPGRLTDEETAIMKTHAEIGGQMMDDLTSLYPEEPLIKVAHDICRWHHERYDGKGYPDGLVGDQIPISAQIVALADVYDALVSDQVYKKALSHEKALQMIMDGQCGAFNPLVLSCLEDIADGLPEKLEQASMEKSSPQAMRSVQSEVYQRDELAVSKRTIELMENEREKYEYFANMTKEIYFEYTASPSQLTISDWGTELLGVDIVTPNPQQDEKVLRVLNGTGWDQLSSALRNTTPDQPNVTFDCKMMVKNEERWMQIVARSSWTADDEPQYTGAVGKLLDIHELRMRMNMLQEMASHDALTGLLNHASARKQIIGKMEARPNSKFALIILDMDYYKFFNDNFGHSFGDNVLIYMSRKLSQIVRSGDIVARFGGDEFLIFMEYREKIEAAVDRIFHSLMDVYKNLPLSVSMGIAKTDMVGTEYDVLFHAADQALYTAKRSGRKRYCFYDESMCQTLSGNDAETEKNDSPGEENL